MAYNLIWSPAARDDLHDIVSFISRDSPRRAEAFGYRLILEIDKLLTFAAIGRIVPEYGSAKIREIIVRSYRIVYRVNHESRLIEIARIWHGARGTPEL
ncbi:MAG TPA: type II toxin-antitoxin system RelE/ParE family toxin [Pyrinomonadaceae bacterium]|jgi:plasmid stabilization system protein ParE|nr:type II toxin-antitoxin system RelE/ParE family toxin [Pyrinomonadaceae bacterium]